MSFSVTTKQEMLTKCLRICCVCLKPSGTKIEIAHIIDKSKGGSNDAENGIPACFDCHHDIGHYRDDHPRGNKYRPEELRVRRNRIYQLVASGAMYAYLIAAQVRNSGNLDIPDLALVRPEPSAEAKEIFQRILAGDVEVGRGGKLRMLDPLSRSLMLDELVNRAEYGKVTESLIGFAKSDLLTADERQVIVDRTTRRITLFGNAYSKASLLNQVPPALFEAVPEEIRSAFFEDVIASINTDQYDVVNKLVPALSQHIAAVPMECNRQFVESLLKQAFSSSFHGAPAAQSMLQRLPENLAAAGINALNVQYLLWYGNRRETKSFVSRYAHLASVEVGPLLQHYLTMTPVDFQRLYAPDEFTSNL